MASISVVSAKRLHRANHVAHILVTGSAFLRFGGRTLAPFFDLFLRLWLAQLFWVSGILKITHWETALQLAVHEYPVSWLDPVTAAYVGAAIETICPVFLAFGLATRLAVIPMLVLALVIQVEYRHLNEHLFWAVLLGWYAVMGAGPISLDRLLGRGLADSALPFARSLGKLFQAVKRYLAPLYQLFIRLGLATVFFVSGLVSATHFSLLYYHFQIPILPPHSIGAPILEIICPVLLILGLATRFTALTAVLLILGVTVTGQHSGLEQIDYLYWLLLLLLLLLYGPGPLAADRLLDQRLRRLFPQLRGLPAVALDELPHVVIVGAGFGGLSAARALRTAACRITVIDRHNYHLFQPLLYQVATAVLSPADIATPIRELFRDQSNARVVFGRVTAVDTENKEVMLGAQRIPYDYLVLATGARHSYFGRGEWEPFAPGLKRIDDATEVRRRLLRAFEEAENTDDPVQRQRLLTFVIVGGGPTGVELAGALAELAHHGMRGEFRRIDPAQARVLLIQSERRLLPAFPEKLSVVAEKSLIELGVEVLTNSRVEQVDEDGVVMAGRRIEARTVLWAAGVMASPAAQWVRGESDRSGRLKVGPDLSVPGRPDIFAIGDTALVESWSGRPVPGLAPAAKQGGRYVAKSIRARLEGRPPPAPFRYRHQGSLATIGRKAAVVDFGWVCLRGAFAWWLWGVVHVLFLAGMRNRIAVAVQWFWAYLTFRRGTRLITGEQERVENSPLQRQKGSTPPYVAVPPNVAVSGFSGVLKSPNIK